MKISATMDLMELRKCVSTTITIDEAVVMRGLLVERFESMDTDDVQQEDWDQILNSSFTF